MQFTHVNGSTVMRRIVGAILQSNCKHFIPKWNHVPFSSSPDAFLYEVVIRYSVSM